MGKLLKKERGKAPRRGANPPEEEEILKIQDRRRVQQAMSTRHRRVGAGEAPENSRSATTFLFGYEV